MGAAITSLSLLVFVGQDFFPSIKSGEMALHVRFPAGTRIEESAKSAVLVEQKIRDLLPGHVTGTLVNCGLPTSGINQTYSDTGTAGSQDCDVTISLDNPASPVAQYRQTLRAGLTDQFPGTEFSFLPGDITAQILNFGLPSPIDVQVSGRNLDDDFAYATKLKARIERIAGTADVRIQQVMGQPTLLIASRRSFALGTRTTESDIANNVLSTLSGSGQVAPTYWLNPKTGVAYLVNIQTPQDQLTTMNALQIIPVDNVVYHNDILPVMDIYANVEGRDLGAVSRAVQAAISETSSELPRGVTAALKGQSTTMSIAYVSLLAGLALSIVLIFLVIVVNFQSWLDPFIVISALPAALAGVTWSLFLTETTLSVPALTGAIMCMGTATANTILVVDYARTRLAEHGDPVVAAVEAGYARIRPVLMTALAMILGMVPMSLSNSVNAPLGRAVIGGLLVATVTTLIFVPCVFAFLHRAKPGREEPA
jgi:multidrug efflux pump subunit AcrB